VQLINVGSSDDTEPIFFELETQDLDFGNKFHKKKIGGKFVAFSDLAGNSRIQVKTDNEDYKGLLIGLKDRVNVAKSISMEGNKFNFKWMGNTTNVSPTFEGFQVEKVTDYGVVK